MLNFPGGFHGNRAELDGLFGSGGPAPNTRSECQPVNLAHFHQATWESFNRCPIVSRPRFFLHVYKKAARARPSKNVAYNGTGEKRSLMPLKPYLSSAEIKLGGKDTYNGPNNHD